MVHMAKKAVLGLVNSLVGGAMFAALLFGCAGRALPFFWAYLGVWAVVFVAGTLVADPTLGKERLRPGPGGKDYLTNVVLLILWVGQFVVAGLDVGRFHWSDSVPLAGQVVGLVVMAAAWRSWCGPWLVNRFFSSVIRIQTDRGHHLITNGPYRYVRHPGYAAAPYLLIGGGLALGSWLAALLGLLMALLLMRRTFLEDRILREQLDGYAAYAEKVRYRVLPGVW